MSATKLFISYSHDDEVWKEKLLDGLRVLERKNSVALWDANELTPGSEWSKQIENALQQSDLAVLLVSPSFLASDFIVNRELPALLERRQKEALLEPEDAPERGRFPSRDKRKGKWRKGSDGSY